MWWIGKTNQPAGAPAPVVHKRDSADGAAEESETQTLPPIDIPEVEFMEPDSPIPPAQMAPQMKPDAVRPKDSQGARPRW